MKVINAGYEIITPINRDVILKRIEEIGRVCYKSEDLITPDSASKFVNMLVKRGHLAMIEHCSISVKFICDRGVSHEIVRHRIASFSQESTRYCNYAKDKFESQITFIQPLWISDEQIELVQRMNEKNYMQVEETTKAWYASILESEQAYNLLSKLGWQPQQARSVLPNSLKTEIVVTANIREWRTIFKQRTAKVAHPQMRELMCPLLDELKTIIPVVFNDITY